MQWSGIGKDLAVVGYVLPGMYRNHPSSGYPSIANAVSCSVGINKRRRKRNFNRIVTLRIGDDPDGDAGMVQRNCLNRIMDNGKLFRDFQPPPANAAQLAKDLAATLPVCPDAEYKIDDDSARFVKQADITEANCYVSARPTPLPDGRTHLQYSIGLTQQCCYDSG